MYTQIMQSNSPQIVRNLSVTISSRPTSRKNSLEILVLVYIVLHLQLSAIQRNASASIVFFSVTRQQLYNSCRDPVYGRSHHNTAIFLNYVTFYPICFGSLLHNLCFVFKMLLDWERGAKTYKTNANKLPETFFIIFLDIFLNRHFFTFLRLFANFPKNLE